MTLAPHRQFFDLDLDSFFNDWDSDVFGFPFLDETRDNRGRRRRSRKNKRRSSGEVENRLSWSFNSALYEPAACLIDEKNDKYVASVFFADHVDKESINIEIKNVQLEIHGIEYEVPTTNLGYASSATTTSSSVSKQVPIDSTATSSTTGSTTSGATSAPTTSTTGTETCPPTSDTSKSADTTTSAATGQTIEKSSTKAIIRKFVRVLPLPEDVDENRVQAKWNGYKLLVELPKTQAGRPRQVQII